MTNPSWSKRGESKSSKSLADSVVFICVRGQGHYEDDG